MISKEKWQLYSLLAFCQGLFHQMSEVTSKYFVYKKIQLWIYGLR